MKKSVACVYKIRVCFFVSLFGLLMVPAFSEAGILAEKAAKFDLQISEHHIPRGLVVNLAPINSDGVRKFRSHGDSTIWTGAYIASQFFRFKVTADHEALTNIEKCLNAFVTLHEMAGGKGFIGRTFGLPEELGEAADIRPGIGSFSSFVYKADTSRDQYTGMLMGCGIAWPVISDSVLRNKIKYMAERIAKNLIDNNLSLKVDLDGYVPSTFDLNPEYAYQDRITPQEWAKVDDFPANVFAELVPYSDRLARIIARFNPPPNRGGEALRALMMLQTASNITGDPEIKKFLSEELIIRRKFHETASDTAQLLADVFYGRNQKVVKDRLYKTFLALGKVFSHVLAMKSGMADGFYLTFEPAFMLPVNYGASFAADLILSALAGLVSDKGFRIFRIPAEYLEDLSQKLEWLKIDRAAERLRSLAKKFKNASNSSMDEFADTMRSYVGCNLGFFALMGILEQNSMDEIKGAAMAVLPRAFAPIADEGNSLYTFIEAAYTGRKPEDPLVAAAKKTLRIYPEDMTNRRFDHSGSLKHSIWPDRFGKYGRQSVEIIPIDQRAPHIFIWQEPPRSMITGADDGCEIAPTGYLLAYWFGRYHGFISAED